MRVIERQYLVLVVSNGSPAVGSVLNLGSDAVCVLLCDVLPVLMQILLSCR